MVAWPASASPSPTPPLPGVYLYDLGSTHGTFLNKERIPAKVRPRAAATHVGARPHPLLALGKEYVRLEVGCQFQTGTSSRAYVLAAPEESSDEEGDGGAELEGDGADDAEREQRRQEVRSRRVDVVRMEPAAALTRAWPVARALEAAARPAGEAGEARPGRGGAGGRHFVGPGRERGGAGGGRRRRGGRRQRHRLPRGRDVTAQGNGGACEWRVATSIALALSRGDSSHPLRPGV